VDSGSRPRWLRITIRVALIVAGVLGVLVLALLASIPIAGIGAERRVAQVANTTIPGTNGQPDVQAYVAVPPGASSTEPASAVIMVHEFWGLNTDIAEKADLLAQEGYVVVAPDVFRGSTTSWIPRAIYQVSSTPAEEIVADLDSVRAWIGQQELVDNDRVAIVGFCFGGRSAMLYSLHNPTLNGTVVFYGNPPLDPGRLRALQGPVLGIFGGADESIPLKDVKAFEAALTQAGVESTVTVYPDQPHAFVDSVESIQAGGAQGEAWAEMVDFLGQAFAGKERSALPPGPQAADDRLSWQYLLRLGLSHMGHDAAH